MKLGQPNISPLRELDLKLVTFDKKDNLDIPGTVKNIISKYGGKDNIFTGYFDEQIYAWQGTGWNFDAEAELRAKLQLDRSDLTMKQISEIIENLKNVTRDLTQHRQDTMQMPYGYFPVKNDVIDLMQGKCVSHNPNYLYERPNNVDYDPTAIPFRTISFLLGRFRSNPKGFFMVLEDFAASLAGRPYNQIIPIWMGKSVRDGFISGGEGKTTTAELLAMLHGKTKTSMMGYEELAGSSFNLQDFAGRSLHILSLDEDTKNQEKFHTVSPAKLFERLRETELTVPVKHSNVSIVIVNPYHIIIGNTLPKLFSNTIASVRSLKKFVEFLDPMPSSEHIILSQFDEREKSGMINLCMPIFRALQGRGKYYGESTLTEAKEKYAEYSDSIGDLIESLYERGEPTDKIESSDVFTNIRKGIKDKAVIMTHPLTMKRLTSEIGRIFGIPPPKRTTTRDDKGEPMHHNYYIGLRKIVDTLAVPENTGSVKVDSSEIRSIDVWKIMDTTFKAVIDYSESVSTIQVHELSLLYNMIRISMRDLYMCYYMHDDCGYKYSNHSSETLIPGVFRHFSTVFDKTEKPSEIGFLGVSTILYPQFFDPLLNDIERYAKSAFVLSGNRDKSDVQNKSKGQEARNHDTPNENPTPKHDTGVSKNENEVQKDQDEGILLEKGNMIRDQLLDHGYLISPDSGTDINGKHYKIGILGINKLPDKKKRQLDNLFRDQKFTKQNAGALGTTWFTRPLKSGVNP